MARRPTDLVRFLNPPTPREIAARNAVASPAPSGHVYGYARVSTIQQADEGEDVQQRVIAGYAQMNGRKAARSWRSCGPATW
jgi:hypothetical protein